MRQFDRLRLRPRPRPARLRAVIGLVPLILASLVGAGLALGATGPPATARAGQRPALPRRALWVTRFDYRTQREVERAIDRAATLGFDTVLFQVRGNATVFYPSELEPWAEQLDWKDPGFDPLGVAVARAHAHGLALHAWMNVVPGWWGDRPPSNGEHLYYKRPEWFWFDQHGKRQALCDRFYVSLNPCLPAVRRHLVAVAGELVSRYPIDGLHLDYIRFPNEAPAVPQGSGLDYPRDPGTLSLFRRATGHRPEDAPGEWDAWRAEQVTTLLTAIRADVKRRDPNLVLSAAVGADPERAIEHFQDVETWLERGLLDAVFPMNYTADADEFERRLTLWQAHRSRAHVVMGTMVSSGESQQRAQQIRRALQTTGAVAVFAYAALWEPPDDTLAHLDEATHSERLGRRDVIEAAVRSPAKR